MLSTFPKTIDARTDEMKVLARLAELEERVARLEALVGGDAIDLDIPGPQPEAAARIIAALPPLRLK